MKMEGQIMKTLVSAFAVASVFFSISSSALMASPLSDCPNKTIASCGKKLPGQGGGDAEYAKYERSLGRYSRMMEMMSKSGVQKNHIGLSQYQRSLGRYSRMMEMMSKSGVQKNHFGLSH
jgi:hypothetical protein